MEYDAAALERVAQRFRRDIWRSVVFDAVVESGVEVHNFGPVQATAFGDLPECHSLNQIQGAAEPGAVEDGSLAEGIEWMRSMEVDYRIPVADGRPGTAEATSWLGARGYERGSGLIKLVRDGSPPDTPEDPKVWIYELGAEDIDGEGLCTVAAEVLGLPMLAETLFFSLPQQENWRCYTAALDPDEGVVATGTMLICDGVAQLGPGTTLEEARGRGCNTALLRRLLLDASEAGCHTVFVELGECEPEHLQAACRNLYRAGFQGAYQSDNWQRPALHPASVR
jgi:GNAT superfamily N-acetyltransferase